MDEHAGRDFRARFAGKQIVVFRRTRCLPGDGTHNQCMKIIVKTFFRTLRTILGPMLLLKEKLTRPKGILRPQAAQQQADLQCQKLALYQYKTCPFCMKVRQEISRLSLNIQRIDAQPPGPDREALTREGGLTKVPCLKITDAAGNSRWLYDSEKIVGYLRGQFAGE